MWFELALLAMIGYGILDFLFKYAEAEKVDFAQLMLYYYGSAAVVAIGLLAYFQDFTNVILTILVGVTQVAGYSLGNVFKLESLRHIKSLIAYPIFSMYGVIVAVLSLPFLLCKCFSSKYAGSTIKV